MPAIQFLEDAAVDAVLDRQLRELLSLCFTKPCELIAHIAVHDKQIGTAAGELRMAGIAEVCVHPQYRGRGLVRDLLATAHAWLAAQGIPVAMLFGDKKHYASSGYRNISNPIRHRNSETGVWITEPSDWAMVKPRGNLDWPAGVVDLRGPTF